MGNICRINLCSWCSPQLHAMHLFLDDERPLALHLYSLVSVSLAVNIYGLAEGDKEFGFSEDHLGMFN